MVKTTENDNKQNKFRNAKSESRMSPIEWGDIFQVIGHPSFILGLDHRIIACNKATAQLTGKTAGQLIGKKCHDIFHNRNKPPKNCPMAKLLRTSRFEAVEMAMEALDRTFLVSCTPMLDKSGKFNRIIHIATDITEHKKVEQKFQEEEERLGIILAKLPDGFFVHDLDGRILQVNNAACAMLGYTEDELTSMKVSDFDKECVTRKDREKIWRKLEKGDSVLLLNATHRRKDGSQYPAEIRINSIVLNKQPVILALVQNITERKLAEKKLRDNQGRLKALASELSYAEERERRRIATGIHDNLSQKLAMTKLNLETLRESVSEQSVRSAIETECGTMAEIIKDTRFLTFELSNPILYEIGLEQAVKNWIKTNIRKRAGLNCEFTSGDGRIEIDEDTKVVLFKAIRELLINVVKHARAGNVEVGIVRQNKDIVVTVEDDGVGFDASKLGLPSGTEGRFGLFNIRERLEYMGGRLEIKSHRGKGTSIVMRVSAKKLEQGQRQRAF